MLAALLASWAKRERVLVHAFVLMNNHIHLSATETVSGGISRMVGYATQALSEWLNEQRGSRGPNWEKRFYASPMDETAAQTTAHATANNLITVTQTPNTGAPPSP